MEENDLWYQPAGTTFKSSGMNKPKPQMHSDYAIDSKNESIHSRVGIDVCAP